MKTLKKLFSVSAIVALLGTLAPMYAFGAGTSLDLNPEFPAAYAYAYSNGITTQTEANVNMGGSLTRIALAKMIANYAINVLGMTPDTSAKCTFTDVTAALDAQYDNGVTLACQLGLMGQNITAFRPNDLVNRGEFGTTLSRALNHDSDDLASMNAADPYYKEHLNFLKSEGIMTKIDNPSQTEVRGYVMLMMMRADETTPSTDGCSAEELLACITADDYDACIAACSNTQEEEEEEDEVKAGTLKVSGSNVDYDSIPNEGTISFGKLKLTATDEDVTVRSISLKKSGGLGSLSTQTKVFLEKDGVRVTGRASFNNGTALITFTTPLVVKSSEELDIMLALVEDASEQFQFTTTDVDSSAEKVNGSYTTKTLTTVQYAIASLTGTAIPGAAGNYKVDSTKLVEFGELSFARSGTTSVTVKAITFNNSGSSDLEYLKDAALYRDSVKVSTKAVVEGRTITFVLDDEIKSTDTSAVNYVVKAKIADADRVGDTYQLYVKNADDINIVETETTFRAKINGVASPLLLKLVTVKGSDLKFTETNVSAIKVVPGEKKVKFYEGKIETSESITLTTLQNVYLASSTSGFDKILDNLYVKIGSQVIAAENIISTTTGTFTFDAEFVVDGTAVFEIYGDIKNDAPGAVITSDKTISDTNFAHLEYTNGQTVVSHMGSISSRKVTISSAAVTLSNNSVATKNVQRGDKKVELGKLEFSTTSDITATLNSFNAALAGNPDNFDGASVAVYNGEDLLASETIASGTPTLAFSFDAIDIVKGTPVELSVVLDTVPATVQPTNTLQLTFNTFGVKANNNTINIPAEAGTALTVITGGQAQVVSQGYSPKMILQGSDEELGSLKLKATNGDVVLTSLTLSGGTSFASSARNLKLMKGEDEVATFVKSGNVFVAEGLDEAIKVAEASTYVVKGKINEATTSSALLAPFSLTADATFESPYGAVLAGFTGEAISADITTVVAYPTITEINGVKGSNYAALKVTFTSDKELQIPASSLTGVIGGNLTGLDGKTWNVGSSVNGTQYDGKDITVQGTTIVYLTVNGLTWSSTTSGDPYINLGLTDFNMNSVFADGTTGAHTHILRDYRDMITDIVDLGVNIK